jgi:hypothetical protein
LPIRPACRRFVVGFHDRGPAQTAVDRPSDRRFFSRRPIGMTGALQRWRLQRINEKESVMNTSSLIHRSLRHELAGRSGHHVAVNPGQSPIRRSTHFEDAVATISLATLSTTVLALVFQSMIP